MAPAYRAGLAATMGPLFVGYRGVNDEHRLTTGRKNAKLSHDGTVEHQHPAIIMPGQPARARSRPPASPGFCLRGGSEAVNPEDKWNEFLEDIGNEVSKLIVPQAGVDPTISQRNFEVFREKVRTFGERWRRHENAIERRKRWGARLWRRAKADTRLQDSPSGTDAPKKNWWWDSHYFFDGLPFLAGPWHEMPAKYVPKVVRGAWKAMMAAIMKNPGAVEDEIPEMLETVGYIRSEYKRLKPAQRKREWVRTDPQTVTFDTKGAATVTPDRPARRFPWWRYMGWDDERAVGCWRPPLKVPENPWQWLIAETETTYTYPHLEVKDLPELDDERELERRYVVLASIYDNMRRGGKRITAVWPVVVSSVRDPWRKDLGELVWDRFSKCREYGPSPGYIQDAVGHVRADLEKRNHEPPGVYHLLLDTSRHSKSPSFKLLQALASNPAGVDCKERAFRSLKEWLTNIDHAALIEHLAHDKKARKLTITLPAGALQVGILQNS